MNRGMQSDYTFAILENIAYFITGYLSVEISVDQWFNCVLCGKKYYHLWFISPVNGAKTLAKHIRISKLRD